jgi:trans-aconitate methyltransferase
MDTKAITRNAYEEGAPQLAEKFNAIGSRRDDIERAFRAISHVSHPHVLEVGCGNGRDAAVILEHPCEYVGIDYSEAMIGLAQQTVPGGTFLCRDMEEYVPEHQIDIVFAFASLLHLPPESFKTYIHMAYAYIAKRGVLYLSVKEGAGEHIKEDATGKRYFYYYSMKDIMDMAQEEGFVVEFQMQKEILGVSWITAMLKKS